MSESNPRYRSHLGRLARNWPASELFQSHDDDFHRFLELKQWERPKDGAQPKALQFLDDRLSENDTLLAIGEGALDARSLFQCFRSDGRPVLYFSPSNFDTRLQSPDSAWGVLVLQLLSQAPQLFSHVEKLCEALSEADAWTGRNMVMLFQRLLAKMASITDNGYSDALLYLLVENIPVNKPEWKSTVELFHSLQVADGNDVTGKGSSGPEKPTLKLLMLYDRGTIAEIHLPELREDVLDTNPMLDEKSLEQFALAAVASFRPKELHAQYRSLILECGYDAQKMYNSRAIVEILKSNLVSSDGTFPRDLWYHLVQQMARVYSSSLWAKIAIGWLVYAKRPLTREELLAAIKHSGGETNIPGDDRRRVDILTSLRAIFGPLIHATNQRICFRNKAIHDNFQKLVSKDHSKQGHAETDGTELDVPDNMKIAEILQRCISQAQSPEKASDASMALKPYALLFWHQHLVDGQADLPKLLSLVQNEDFAHAWQKLAFESYWSKSQRTESLSMGGPLVLAAQVGVLSAVASLKTSKPAAEIGSAIVVAARYDNADVVSMLLSSLTPSEVQEESAALDAALEISSLHNCVPIMRQFLDRMKGAKDGRAELLSLLACQAARFGYEDQLRLLVSYGAQVDTPVLEQKKPLHQAAQYGHLGLVVFLVTEKGAAIYDKETPADDNATNDTKSEIAEENDNNRDTLYIAAKGGHTDIVAFLLSQTIVDIDGYNDGCGASDNIGHAAAEIPAKNSGGKAIAPWSAIEEAMTVACREFHVETARRILRHATITNVPRPVNSALLCSAIQAENRPDDESLAMLILKSAKPIERMAELIQPFVCAAGLGQLPFIKHCVELSRELKDTETLLLGSDSADMKALHRAANGGYVDIVKYLLVNGANVNGDAGTTLTSLARAATAGHAEIVRLLLRAGADVQWVGASRRSILTLAAMSPYCDREVDVIRLLLDSGASLNALDGAKRTPLHWAARRGNINILEVLLKQEGIGATMKGERDRNVLHLAAQGPARTATIAAEMLIAANVSPRESDVDGWLPLHLAACWGGVDLMEFLLTKDKDMLGARMTNGDTILHVAYRNCEAMIWVIEQGFNIDVENNEGMTVLMNASKNGVDESVGLLMAFGANTDVLDSTNRSALHHAVETKNTTIAHMLLDANAAVLFQLDSAGLSVLYTAIMQGLTGFALRVLKVLETYSAAHGMHDELLKVLNAVTGPTQRTPLLLAARRDLRQLVEKIVQLGADLDKRDYTGATALVYAIKKENEKTVRTILDAQSNVKKPAISARHGHHRSNSHGHSQSGGHSSVHPATLQWAAMAGQVDMVKLLLSYGVDVNEQSGQFNTALTAAAAGGYSDVVGLLLENDANAMLSGGSYPSALSAAVSSGSKSTFNLLLANNKTAVLSRDIQGRNALHIAVQSGFLYAFETILGVVENLNERADLRPFGTATEPDKQGRRLLHFAACGGDAEVLRYFLAHPKLRLESEIDIIDNDGWTPLHWACRADNGGEIVEILLGLGSDPSMETRDGWTPLTIAEYHDAADNVAAITEALKQRAEKIAERNAGKKTRDTPETSGQDSRHLAPGFVNWGVTCDGCLLVVSWPL